jgi:hypothetical protein
MDIWSLPPYFSLIVGFSYSLVVLICGTSVDLYILYQIQVVEDGATTTFHSSCTKFSLNMCQQCEAK